MRYVALSLLVLMTSCTSLIADPSDGSTMAKCHVGAFVSFCKVRKDAGEEIVTGTGVVPTVNSSAGIVTEGGVLGHGLVK
jgi:hypothetical protein